MGTEDEVEEYPVVSRLEVLKNNVSTRNVVGSWEVWGSFCYTLPFLSLLFFL